jgi:hypothetical protein
MVRGTVYKSAAEIHKTGAAPGQKTAAEISRTYNVKDKAH